MLKSVKIYNSKRFIHSNDGETFLDSIKYEYNDHGQLTSKKGAGLDLKLYYNNPPKDGTPKYDGSLTAQTFQTPSMPKPETILYSYYKTGYLQKTKFKNQIFDEDFEYDLNGNVLKMNRFANPTKIDELTYKYSGNQLTSVKDETNNPEGFRDFTWEDNLPEYEYDANGNMIYDRNRNILLEYNPLNRTTKIHTRGYEDHTISVLYSAAGNKLRETFTNYPGEQANKIDYVGPFVFHNGTLDHINTDYGRISVSSKISNYDLGFETPVYTREYDITDHQGSVRATLNDKGNNIQEGSYYAFGMTISVLTHFHKTYNPILFQSKPLTLYGDLGFQDFGSRWYDPVLGRWHAVDPALQFANPYLAMGNRADLYDPNGEIIEALLFGGLINLGIYLISKSIKREKITFNDAFGSFVVGALAGVAGAGVGQGVASLTGTIGFWGGAISGAAGGAVGGFLGGTTNAWLEGANFSQGLGAGLTGAAYGAAFGGVIGGLGGGIYARKHGGNFWSGKGATFDFLKSELNTNFKSDPVEYNQKSGTEFYNKSFKDIKHVDNLITNGNTPKNYITINETVYNSDLDPVYGTTEFNGFGKGNNVYIFKDAFSSPELLYITMGHEFLHAGYNNISFDRIANKDYSYHYEIYNWEVNQFNSWNMEADAAISKSLMMKAYKIQMNDLIFMDINLNPNYRNPIIIKPWK